MNAWGEEDPPLVDAGPVTRRHRLHGRHLMVLGVVCVALWPVVSAVGAVALGPMMAVLGVTLLLLGAVGWLLERAGAFDDDPGGPGSIGLLDVAHLARRQRHH